MGGLRRALLLGLALVVTYGWMIRLGADLGWDEALNLKTYSRHPLTALGLYHEPNNHPLESLLKSLFYRVLGWDSPEFFRFTGYLLIAGWLALAWAWYRRLERRGSIVAATVIVLVMLLSRSLEHQAAALRGYFLSMLLELLYLLWLERDTGWLDEPGTLDDRTAPPTWRRAVLRYGGLGALILFTVPSNVLAMPALWLLTAGALAPGGTPWHRGLLRRAVTIAGATLLITLVLFAPILIGLAVGVSSLHRTPEWPAEGLSAAVLGEIELVVQQLAPRGVPVGMFGVGLLALVVAALVFRRHRRVVWLALTAAAVCVLARIAASTVVGFPDRIKSPLVPPIAMAVVALVHVLTAERSARSQNVVALVLLLGCCATVPHIVRDEEFERDTSHMVAFVQAYARPDERRVLVGHAGIQFVVPYLDLALGADRVVGSQSDLARRTDPEPPPEPETWQDGLRDSILGSRTFAPLDLSTIDVLVLIEFGPREGAFSWTDRAMKDLTTRLGRVSRFSMGRYRLMVFEAP